ncbi:hypothetical protein [Phocaeicola faecalis]|uniref:hypothetical protein n=1 Tax=Phocaeicola faecalis TaxID=2786956 RepID=UPI001F2DA073|nr:hypothetical protein [Phocaeicola faecalis]
MSNTKHKTLEVEVLNIHKGEYLSEALKRQGYPMLPSNAIINKVMTGTGATYMELNPKLSPRNSIVIEPFKSAVEDKVQVFNKAQGVFKEVTVRQLTTYLKNPNIKHKKIITTPEGFQSKVLTAAKQLGMNIYKEYFCLFDESEHITEDTGYRRSISAPMREFFKFERKALVSATPLKPSKYTLTLFLRHQFKWVEIKPDYDYREDMTLITTRSFYRRVKQEMKRLLDNGSPHVCIFYKTTEGINNIVESLLHDGIITKDDYKVFCSKKSADELKSRFLEHSTDKLELPLKKVNLFTSRFFPSIDINLKELCDVLILSNYDHVKHTLINPFTEAIQCQGRFRRVFPNGKRYNSLTVIASIPNELEVKSDAEIQADIKARIKCYRAIQKERLKADDSTYYDKELKRLRLNEVLNPERNGFDRFAIEQLLLDEQVKRYYISPNALRRAYEDTGYFNVDFQPEDEAVGEDDIYRIKAAKTKEKWQSIVSVLSNVKEDETAVQFLKAKCLEEEWLINAFFKLGQEVIEQQKYSKTAIKKLLLRAEQVEAEQKLKSREFLLDMKSEFETDTGNDSYLPLNDVLGRISYLLECHGITYSRYGDGKKDTMCKLSEALIKDYFDVKRSNRDGAKVKLNRFKNELLDQE